MKIAVNALIPQVSDFEELLSRLQAMGYEIKPGKYVSCRAPGQERFTRLKTLGADYTEEALRECIKGTRTRTTKAPKQQRNGISLLIDIQNSIKAQESRGYEQWAKIHNLKQAAKALQTAGIKKLPNLTSLQAEYEQLQRQKETLYTDYGKLKKQVKEYDVIKRNIDSILRQDKKPECNKEATRE